MNRCILDKLKSVYGEDWWYDGVPHNVRTKCATRKEEDRGAYEPEQYLDLIDYKAIAMSSSNWSKVFHECLVVSSQQGDKKKKLAWIDHLNEIRKTVSHPERGLLTTEQVDFVNDLHRLLQGNLREYWQS